MGGIYKILFKEQRSYRKTQLMANEDDTDKWLDRFKKPAGKQLCLKKYTTKDKNGNTVTRTCIKKRGHFGGHK